MELLVANEYEFLKLASSPVNRNLFTGGDSRSLSNRDPIFIMVGNNLLEILVCLLLSNLNEPAYERHA